MRPHNGNVIMVNACHSLAGDVMASNNVMTTQMKTTVSTCVRVSPVQTENAFLWDGTVMAT